MNESLILNAKKAGDIFSYDEDLKKQYIAMSKKFHPDVYKSSKANEIMVIINTFYEQAQEMIEKGTWVESNSITFSGTDGKKRKINYLTEFDFELGKTFVATSVVCFLFDKDKEIYYNNYMIQARSLKFENDKMKEQFKNLTPKIIDNFITKDGKFGIVVSKKPQEILLTDLLKYVNILEDRHIAWVLGRLYSLSCFFYYNGIAHNGISLETVYVNPETHSVSILGGWEYTKKLHEKMVGIKKLVYDLLPVKTKEDKLATHIADLEGIRLIGRQLLGFKNITQANKSSVPKSFISWVWSGSSENSYEEYTKWEKVLKSSYGERKFIKLDLTPQKIYGERK